MAITAVLSTSWQRAAITATTSLFARSHHCAVSFSCEPGVESHGARDFLDVRSHALSGFILAVRVGHAELIDPARHEPSRLTLNTAGLRRFLSAGSGL